MRSLLTLLAVVTATAAAAPPFVAMHGTRRILVIAAPAPGTRALATQDRLLAADPAGLAERDVAIVHVVGTAVSGASDDAAALRRRLGIAPDAFAVRLIGKDGHVAFAGDRPVASARLFATIDAMPMRRDEMRRGGIGKARH